MTLNGYLAYSPNDKRLTFQHADGRVSEVAQFRDVPGNTEFSDHVGRLACLGLPLVDAIKGLIDDDDASCRFDHHGFCQEHGSGPPCAVAWARHLLAQAAG